jgi:hypothetical protein
MDCSIGITWELVTSSEIAPHPYPITAAESDTLGVLKANCVFRRPWFLHSNVEELKQNAWV